MSNFNDYLAIRETKEQLTPHFSYWEMIKSGTALSHKIPNIPSDEAKENLIKLCKVLEQIRKYLDVPIPINSGFRSVEVNRSIGGSATSSHVYGCAADLKISYKLYTKIVDGIKQGKIDVLDQIIFYPSENFIHVGIVNPKHKAPRRELWNQKRLICKF